MQGSLDYKYTFLRKTPPFDLLEEKLLCRIASQTQARSYRQGSYVFREGDSSQKVLFVVMEGQARIEVSNGKELNVAGTRNPGDFFGETVFLSGDPYPASVYAYRNLECLLVSQESFEEALSKSRHFANFFTQALTARLKVLYQNFMFEYTGRDVVPNQPLRQRVSEVMVSGVVTCLPMETIQAVARKMSAHSVSSAVVVAPNRKPVGIITEKDLVKKILAVPQTSPEIRAHEIMSENLITVAPRDFAYQALFLMVKHRIKHVVVVEGEILRGIVTVQDLVRNRNTGALNTANRIEAQHSVAGLADIIPEVDQVQRALISERAYAAEICALVTEFYDRITRRIIEISEQEMAAAGWGAPPVPYCFINMGSAGRKEQYSRTDQDNGIIYRDPEGGEKAREDCRRYFLALGGIIVDGLERCGFKRCKGGVMAGNPQWCAPLSGWRDSVDEWVDRLDPKNIRNMTIFLDFRYLAGDRELCESLKEHTARLFRNSPQALLLMAEDDLRHRVPLNMFRQIVTERSGKHRKKINLKSMAGVHLLDCVRLFALREGIKESNTFERIGELKRRAVFTPEEAEYISAAYETLLMLRLRDALQKIKQGAEPDNYINPEELSRKEQSLLKESLLVVNRLQTLTAHAFRAQNF